MARLRLATLMGWTDSLTGWLAQAVRVLVERMGPLKESKPLCRATSGLGLMGLVQLAGLTGRMARVVVVEAALAASAVGIGDSGRRSTASLIYIKVGQ